MTKIRFRQTSTHTLSLVLLFERTHSDSFTLLESHEMLLQLPSQGAFSRLLILCNMSLVVGDVVLVLAGKLASCVKPGERPLHYDRPRGDAVHPDAVLAHSTPSDLNFFKRTE